MRVKPGCVAVASERAGSRPVPGHRLGPRWRTFGRGADTADVLTRLPARRTDEGQEEVPLGRGQGGQQPDQLVAFGGHCTGFCTALVPFIRFCRGKLGSFDSPWGYLNGRIPRVRGVWGRCFWV